MQQSFHPPSRLLLFCLAITNLCVGLIAQPLYTSFLLSQEHSKYCYISAGLTNVIAVTFCGMSLSTLTAISLDRLLALLLGLRYRQVVTLRRVRLLVIIFWLNSIMSAIILFFLSRYCHTHHLHKYVIMHSYLNVLLRHNICYN